MKARTLTIPARLADALREHSSALALSPSTYARSVLADAVRRGVYPETRGDVSETLNLRLPEELDNALRVLAEAAGISWSALAREMLAELVPQASLADDD